MRCQDVWEEHFKNPEIVELYRGERIRVVDLRPENLMGKVQQHVNPRSITGFYSVRSTHCELNQYPNKFARIINQALSALAVISLKKKSTILYSQKFGN